MAKERAPIVEVAPSMPAADVVERAAKVLSSGGVVAFPTDTLYAIGCEFGREEGIARIHAMRGSDGAKRPLTFLLPDLGAIPHWARVNEPALRVLNRIFPGPYCAELLASARVPAPFIQGERRTIGVRIPDVAVCEKILWRVGRPVLSATAKSPAGQLLTTAADIQSEIGDQIDLILDGGSLAGPPSTVVSLIDEWPTVLREGRGPANKITSG